MSDKMSKTVFFDKEKFQKQRVTFAVITRTTVDHIDEIIQFINQLEETHIVFRKADFQKLYICRKADLKEGFNLNSKKASIEEDEG